MVDNNKKSVCRLNRDTISIGYSVVCVSLLRRPANRSLQITESSNVCVEGHDNPHLIQTYIAFRICEI